VAGGQGEAAASLALQPDLFEHRPRYGLIGVSAGSGTTPLGQMYHRM